MTRSAPALEQMRRRWAMTRYFRQATAQGIDPAHPSFEWLKAYVHWVAMVESINFGRFLIDALNVYFRAFHLENPLDKCDRPLLCTPSAHTVVDATSHSHGRYGVVGNPEIFAKDFRRYTESWEQYAYVHDTDPHAPRAEDIAGFLALRAEHNRYNTIVTIRGYLRTYFYDLGVKVIDEPLINMTMTGIRHAEKRHAPPAYRADELREAFSELTMSRLDVRDRLATLLFKICGFRITELQRLSKQDVTLCDNENGMYVIVRGGRRFVGNGSDRDLDPVYWMKVWLALSPSESGPLFPRMRRGGETDIPVSCTCLRAAISRLLKSAREHSAPAIRKSFIATSARRNGAIVTAHYLRYRALSSLSKHVPEVEALNEYLRQISKVHRRPRIRYK